LPLPDGATASLAVFSPGGSNLAIFDNTAGVLYLLPLQGGRPGNVRVLDLSVIGAPLAMLAVSDGDDRLIAGITAVDPAGAFVADMGGKYRAISSFDRPTSVTFLGGTGDVVFADSGTRTVSRIADPLSGAAPEAIPFDGLGDNLRVSSSPDVKTLLVLDGSRTVRSVDVKSGTVSAIECDCAPGAGQALRGRSVFRLTDALDQPVWILDAGWSEPRLVFVPAVPSEAVSQ